MLGSLDTVNLDLIHLVQEERLTELRSHYAQKNRLAEAGYVPPADRARSALAAVLLHLAFHLDRRVMARVEPTALEMRTA